MVQSNLSKLMDQEFHRLSRKLTYITIAIICICSVIFWWFGVDAKGKWATLIGITLIILAAFTFKIPYISYRYMQVKYKSEPKKLSALEPNWREFRDRVMQRR